MDFSTNKLYFLQDEFVQQISIRGNPCNPCNPWQRTFELKAQKKSLNDLSRYSGFSCGMQYN